MNYKKGVMRALENYYKKQEPEGPKTTRKNEKPEKKVEQDVLLWCKRAQFDMDIIEAKAKFNTQTMRYTGRAATKGLSDLIGNTPTGLAVFIELKAEGRRIGSALRVEQRQFLQRKIATGCFAVVTDSQEYLDRVWNHFCSLPTSEERIQYLLKELPEHNPRQLNLDQSPGTGEDDENF